MNVSLDCWRAVIGNFNNKLGSYSSSFPSDLSTCCSFIGLIFSFFAGLFTFSLLTLDGDVEPNPGPRSRKNDGDNISLCHWNLNSIAAHNYAKIDLLKAFNSSHNYDFIFLSETFLDSTIPSDLDMLNIDGYRLVRADHRSDSKRGGVCCYIKESLPVVVIDVTFLAECLLLKLGYKNQNIVLGLSYRSPSQNTETFFEYLSHLESLLKEMRKSRPLISVLV